jgi:anti-sigma-K factor RskA
MTANDRLLAAELVLGLLDDADRAAALERLLADPAFAEEVAWWQLKLAPLLAEYAGATPPPALEERIEALLREPHERDGTAPLALPGKSAPRWRWLGAGVAGGAIAASLAAMLLIPASPPPMPVPVAPAQRPLLVAALAPTPGQERAPVAIVIDKTTRTLRLGGAIEVPAGRSAEFWRIGPDKVPVALGILHTDAAGRITLTVRELPRPTDTIAVSIEPLGGAPGAAPTGPVVATGVLATA